MADAAKTLDAGSRPRALPLTVGLVGVLLLLLGAAIVLRGQKPLAPVATIAAGPEMLSDVIPTGTDRQGIAIVYDHEQPASFAMELRNDGPVGITITGLGTEADQLHLLQPYGVFVMPAGADLDVDADDAVEMQSFALAPGESRVVLVRGSFANCRYYNERNIDLRTKIRVDYRILGVPASQMVEFDKDLLVKSPMIVGCPERTVNREDDRRKDVTGD